jgi:hypothetical protein
VQTSLIVRRGRPAGALALDHQQFGGIKGGEDWKQIGKVRVGRHAEFRGRKIQPRGVQPLFVRDDRGEVMIPGRIELVGGEGGAGERIRVSWRRTSFPALAGSA